jgi:RimJ/RimL family protein N-acetyltransferase
MMKKLKIGYLVNFKKAKLPNKTRLLGKYTILEPLQIKRHSTVLFNTFLKDKSKNIWTYMPYGPFKNLKTFVAYLKKHCLKKDPFFYAIYSKRFKSFCGLASYLRMKPDVGVIEVGWITYAPILQNTVEGTEAMYLMMKNVFDNLGYRRYEWKCDNLNSKSKKAASRLGFRYEGLFRQATIYKKRNRDTAWFSIIDKEWKQYKKSYSQYLKRSNFNLEFTQKKKLKLT